MPSSNLAHLPSPLSYFVCHSLSPHSSATPLFVPSFRHVITSSALALYSSPSNFLLPPLLPSASIIARANTRLTLPLVCCRLSSAATTFGLSIIPVALICCRMVSSTNTFSNAIIVIHFPPSQWQRGWSSCLKIIILPTQVCAHPCCSAATVAPPPPQSLPAWSASMCCHCIHHHHCPNLPCSWLLICCWHCRRHRRPSSSVIVDLSPQLPHLLFTIIVSFFRLIVLIYLLLAPLLVVKVALARGSSRWVSRHYFWVRENMRKNPSCKKTKKQADHGLTGDQFFHNFLFAIPSPPHHLPKT